MRESYTTLGHKLLWTFIQAFVGIMIAAAWFDWNTELFQVALGSGISSALVVLKEFSREQLSHYGE
jgi:hypothetical protein